MSRTKKIKEIIEYINELKEDDTINDGIKAKLDTIINHLKEEKEIGIDKSVHEIEEMMENNELSPYVRTQLWGLTSMLESV